MNRRKFILGSVAVGGAIATNLGLNSLTFAKSGGRTKTIVKVFQRGGADGLHLFPPVHDPDYHASRSSVKVEPFNGDANSSIRLLKTYAMNPGEKIHMNPNLSPLLRIWEAGQLAISPATHYENSNRSHFSTQKILEYGGDLKLSEGFFNRYLQKVKPELNDNDTLRAVRAGASTVAPVFVGKVPVPIISNNKGGLVSEDFCSGTGCADNQLTEMIRKISSNKSYNTLENHVRRADQQVVDTIDIVTIASKHETKAGGLEYSDTDIGRGLKLVSQLLKDDHPIELASVNWTAPGWDTHAGHVIDGESITNEKNNHVISVKGGASDLLTFYLDMENSGLLKDVVVIVGSEFGRTVKQNGSHGTDHGYGSAWFAFGGPTKGGVYSPYDNLRQENLQDGRYVPHKVNYQDIVGEAMMHHLGIEENVLDSIFPNHSFSSQNMFS